MLLNERTLEVSIEIAQVTIFKSNAGSSQGENIGGSLFTIYFNNALKQLNDKFKNN